jgi:hypothetical protein
VGADCILEVMITLKKSKENGMKVMGKVAG